MSITFYGFIWPCQPRFMQEKQSNQKCVFIFLGLRLLRARKWCLFSSASLGRARGRCAGISLRLNCPETRDRLKCPAGTSRGPRRDFGRGARRHHAARASKFVPAATALSAAVLLTQFAKITKASGRPAQAISWWCFFSLALRLCVCLAFKNTLLWMRQQALGSVHAYTAPRPHLTKKRVGRNFSAPTEEMALN